MKSECIEAVQAAAGRNITEKEIADIESRISRNMRGLAKSNRARWAGLPEEARLMEASAAAAKEIESEAQLKKYRLARHAMRHSALTKEYERMVANGHTGIDSLRRIITFDPDTKSGLLPLESIIKATQNFYLRDLIKAFEVTHPKILGLFANVDGMKAFLNELWGRESGVPEAKAGAKVWRETTEAMRQAFNNMGGKIGNLENWNLPQYHSTALVRGDGTDAARDAWVSETISKLDRTKYVREDGSLMDENDLKEVLQESWMSIATDGANKIQPGKNMGTGMRANAHADERVLYFRDPDSWLAYMDKYGGTDIYGILVSHVQKLGRDIAITEHFGPDPHAIFQFMLQSAEKHDKVTLRRRPGKVDAEVVRITDEYNFVTGRVNPPANERLANWASTITNWMVATKLGSAFISSIPDNASLQLTARFYNMSSMRLMRNQLAQLDFTNSTDKRLAESAGLALDTYIGEVNRFGQDMFAAGFSQKAANVTMRASFLNAVTEARRRAFGALVFSQAGSLTKKYTNLAHLEEDDARLFTSKGIDEETWQIWRAAPLEDWGYGNNDILTANAIMRADGYSYEQKRAASIKLLALTDEETSMAVITPGVRERTAMGAGMRRGTWKGEMVRAFFLFKGFPITQFARHMRRATKSGRAPASKAAYVSAFFAGTTLLGAAAVQLYELINGRDPMDMSKGNFWASSFLKGGSLGVYGDFLVQSNTSYGNTPTAILSGPIVSSLEDFIGLTQGNLVQLAQGKNTNAGAEFVQFLKNNTPLQNLWYTRAATDRLVFGQMQEMIEPGYLNRVQHRMERDYGKSYYAPLSVKSRVRAPDFPKAFGK